MLALMLLVAGCIIIPPFWHGADEIYHVNFVEPGVTTKDEVIAELGEPDRSYERDDETVYRYEGHTGGVIFVGVIPPGAIFDSGSTEWWVSIEFDENDVVSEIKTSEDEVDDLGVDEIRRDNFNNQLKSACAGDKLAQFSVADHYANGKVVERDNVQAFKWYSLSELQWSDADQFFPDAIQYLKNELRQKMTLPEIAEAERLAAEWKPNQAGCQQNGISSED